MINTLPFHKKDLMPKTKRDFSLFLFLTTAIGFFCFWELGVIMPQYHSSLDFVALFHIISAIFIVTNISGNIYYMKRIDVTGKQLKLPHVLLEGWNYCYICQNNAPPRTHHCNLCGECILKRDHHCMFTGCCIGYFNQRYYVLAVFYLCLGALYCTIHHWTFSLDYIGGSFWFSAFAMVAPHFALFSGSLSLSGFGVISLHTFSIIATVLTGYLLAQQALCIIKGQTMFEKREAIFCYDLGFQRNFLHVFGHSWKKALVWPWAESQLPGDGITYPLAGQLEGIKDI